MKGIPKPPTSKATDKDYFRLLVGKHYLCLIDIAINIILRIMCEIIRNWTVNLLRSYDTSFIIMLDRKWLK